MWLETLFSFQKKFAFQKKHYKPSIYKYPIFHLNFKLFHRLSVLVKQRFEKFTFFEPYVIHKPSIYTGFHPFLYGMTFDRRGSGSQEKANPVCESQSVENTI